MITKKKRVSMPRAISQNAQNNSRKRYYSGLVLAMLKLRKKLLSRRKRNSNRNQKERQTQCQMLQTYKSE